MTLSEDGIPETVPAGARIQFAHHVIKYDDDTRVGVSVGGRGVPLVFFHGIGMHRQVYLKLLSRLPQLGFLVVAIDAPGHGQTSPPKFGEHTFAHRMAATERALERLGIERALLVGHSMGGRTAAELAARRPERALAVVLIDPAVGSAFDAMRERIGSPVQTGSALAAALGDTIIDRVGLRRLDHLRYLRTLARLFIRTATHPALFASTAAAIAQAEVSATALTALNVADLRVALIHGEKDMIVPLESAVEAAALSDALLVTLPMAYHSWVLTTPWTFAKILNELITKNLLGDDLREALASARQLTGPKKKVNSLYQSEAPVLEMSPPIKVLGGAYPSRHRMYHPYRFWDPAEVTRFASS